MTKETRKIVYWATMFEIVAFGLRDGICYSIKEAIGDYPFNLSIEFPELWATKPEKTYNSAYWFCPERHINDRLECLSKAISLIK